MSDERDFNKIEASVLLEALQDADIDLLGYFEAMIELDFTKAEIKKRLISSGLFEQEEWAVL